jgi:dihydroorotate dehydrogenase (NAD+) catalytic subunit
VSRASRRRRDVDTTVSVGSVDLVAPVLTAAGTSGHGAELAAYFDLSRLGAVVVKSLAATPWPGNPPPRVVPVAAGMLNSVGLQGPGVAAFLAEELPALEAAGATVVVSIWGRSVAEFAAAAELVAPAPPSVVAVEVNVSCPNVEERSTMFAHSPAATAAAVAAARVCGRPLWAKLSPNVTDITAIARAAVEAGAEALTLVNTLMGLSIDLTTRRASLGAGGGGLSGPALHSVACRAVYDCHAALPTVPLIGVGGVRSGEDAIELVMAGATAVGVGTATFADPRAPLRVLDQVVRWCADNGVSTVRELVGAAHGR